MNGIKTRIELFKKGVQEALDAYEFRAELEEELRWRQEELVFFKNQLSNIESEIDADRYRKSLVLIFIPISKDM